VLKSLVQRYNNPEEKSFVILFVGELIGDIVSLMQRALLVVFSFLPSKITEFTFLEEKSNFDVFLDVKTMITDFILILLDRNL
jgi:hypothetical protein